MGGELYEMDIEKNDYCCGMVWSWKMGLRGGRKVNMYVAAGGALHFILRGRLLSPGDIPPLHTNQVCHQNKMLSPSKLSIEWQPTSFLALISDLTAVCVFKITLDDVVPILAHRS